MPGYKSLRKNKKYGKTALAYAVEKVYSDIGRILQERMTQEEFDAFIEKMELYKSGEKEIMLDDAVKSRLGGLEKFHQIMENPADDKLGIELMETMKKIVKAERDKRAAKNDPFLPIYDYYLFQTTDEGSIMEARFESQYLAHLNQFSGMPRHSDDNNEMKKNLQQEKNEVTGEPEGLYEPLMDFYKGYIELEKMELVRQKNNREGWSAEKERAFLAELRKKQQNMVDAFDKIYAIEDNHQYDNYLCNDLGHITGRYGNRRSSFEAVNVLRWQIKAIENGWSQDELNLLGAIGYIEAAHKSNEEEFNSKMANYHTRVEKHKDDWGTLTGDALLSYGEARRAVLDEQSNRLKIESFAKDIAALKEQIWDKKVSSPEDKATIIALVDKFAKSHSNIKLDNFLSLNYLSKPVEYNLGFIEEVKKLKPNRRKYKLYDWEKYNPPENEDIKNEAPKNKDVKNEAPKEDAVKLADAPAEKVGEEKIEEEKTEDEKVEGDAVIAQNNDVPEENPENEAGIRKAYDSQGELVDRYMYVLLYKTRNYYLDVIGVDKINADELRDARSFDDAQNVEDVLFYKTLDDFAGKKFTEEDVDPLYEKLMLARTKVMVLTGKNFKAIHDSIEGEYKYDKALLAASEAGVFDPGDVEDRVRIDILCNDKFMNVFKTKLKYDPDMTYEQAFNNLGFTREEQEFVVEDPLKLKTKVRDSMYTQNIPGDEMKSVITSSLYNAYMEVHKLRGMKKALEGLSAEEKMYYDIGSKAHVTSVREKVEKEQEKDREAVKWSKDEAADKISKISIYFKKDQLNTLNAFLYGEKTIGISRKNEMNGAYRDMYNRNNDYIGAILKGQKGAEAKAASDVNDKKLQKSLGTRSRKLGVSISSYIKLHSGLRMGKTPDEMVENLAKCMAAGILYSKGSKFDLDKIHNVAKACKEIYSMDALKDDPEQLMSMLKNSESLTKGINSLRDAIYKVTPAKMDKYFEDMKALADNLPTMSGHGRQYSKLNGLIRDAAALRDKDLSKEEIDVEVRNINIKIYNAAVKYFESKGINKLDVTKNPRAAAALNAISVLTKSTGGLTYRTTKLVVDIKKSLDARHDSAAESFESVERFTQKYGAQNTAMQKDIKKASAAKNKNAKVGK